MGFLLIFAAILAATLSDQTLNKQIDGIIRSPQGLSNMIWLWGALSLLSVLFFPLLISLLCSHTLAISNFGFRSFFNEKFELGLIEQLRAWGKSFLWTFVFIIPGIIFTIIYTLVPFVVFFSRKYANGQVDALKFSFQLAKKFFLRLVLWMIIFYVALPMTTSVFLDEYKLFSLHPVTALACVLLETLLALVFHYFLLQVFLKYLNEVEDGVTI